MKCQGKARDAEKPGEVFEIVLYRFYRKKDQTRSAWIVTDKELPQIVIYRLVSFCNLLNTGANDREVLFAEAAAHQGGPRRGVSEKLVLRD